jgi:hypothetical protein
MNNLSYNLRLQLCNLMRQSTQYFKLQSTFKEGNNLILFNDDVKIKHGENYLLKSFYFNCYKIKDKYFINIPNGFFNHNEYIDKLNKINKNHIIIDMVEKESIDIYGYVDSYNEITKISDKNNILKNIKGDDYDNLKYHITENNIKILFYCNDENNINSLVMDIYQFLIDEALIKL